MVIHQQNPCLRRFRLCRFNYGHSNRPADSMNRALAATPSRKEIHRCIAGIVPNSDPHSNFFFA